MNYSSQQAEVSKLIQRYKSGFRVRHQTREEIRSRAAAVRPLLLQAGDNFDIETFLESLTMFNITYDVVEDYYLPRGVEAACFPGQMMIHITAATFNDMVDNDGRARFTLFHELGHLLLAHSHAFHKDDGTAIDQCENSEWQADQFAAEMLMPLNVILSRNLTTPSQLMRAFGVAEHEATYRLKKLREYGEIKSA
jgi:Zn-dependent peptidase ImmA (M78 family)